MKSRVFLFIFLSSFFYGCAQQKAKTTSNTAKGQMLVGGACEGCEAIHESPLPFNSLDWRITLSDYNDAGPKIFISGVVYQKDGKTPAPEVVLYVYHTDQTGIYPKKGNETGWGKRHGYLRAWMKTNVNGEYAFYTLKPAAYPGRSDPAHIHITIKEPDKNEYYIDDFVFDDDPLLTAEYKNRLQNLGGSGVLKLQNKNGLLYGKRNIILGKNVTDYP